jgi:hypothetical protein
MPTIPTGSLGNMVDAAEADHEEAVANPDQPTKRGLLRLFEKLDQHERIRAVAKPVLRLLQRHVPDLGAARDHLLKVGNGVDGFGALHGVLPEIMVALHPQAEVADLGDLLPAVAVGLDDALLVADDAQQLGRADPARRRRRSAGLFLDDVEADRLARQLCGQERRHRVVPIGWES